MPALHREGCFVLIGACADLLSFQHLRPCRECTAENEIGTSGGFAPLPLRHLDVLAHHPLRERALGIEPGVPRPDA